VVPPSERESLRGWGMALDLAQGLRWVSAPASTAADGIGRTRKPRNRRRTWSHRSARSVEVPEVAIVSAWPDTPNALVSLVEPAGCREKSDGLPQAYQ
jgi:hypothetical protein